jgi:hypothetical protein
LLPSLSALERRKRQVRLLAVFVALVLVVGLVLWRYGAELVWSPEQPAPGDGVEEPGAAQ